MKLSDIQGSGASAATPLKLSDVQGSNVDNAPSRPTEYDLRVTQAMGQFPTDPNLSVSDLVEMAKGIIPGALGWPGDIASLVRSGVEKVGIPKTAAEFLTPAASVLPTTGEISGALNAPPNSQRAAAYRQIGELSGSMLGPEELVGAAKGVALVPKAIRAIGEHVGEVSGSEAAKAAEALRSSSISRASDVARANEQAARTVSFSEERGRVLDKIRGRVRALENSYQESGMSADHARQLADQSETHIAEAENAANALDDELLSRPRMSADDFGALVREKTQQLSDKYTAQRAAQSGFKDAVDNAAGYLRVDTSPIQKEIDAQLKGVRNPSLKMVLTQIKQLLKTGQTDALSIKSADSLRGYLDSVIQSRQLGNTKIDRETVYFLRQIKRGLVRGATESWQPYREALARWRTLSRPLDIVERNGALRQVLDTDPISTEYKMTEAQVAGHLLTKARAGQPVISRLIAENPELKDAARLYFTQDLFGRDEVPTAASLHVWLARNERPLRQAGLYDDFKDIRTAKDTAQRAIDDAKNARIQSLEDARIADKRQREIGERLKQQESMREKEKSRISGDQKAVERSMQIADRYRQLEVEIKTAPDEQVATHVANFVRKLRDDKLIDDTEYGNLLTQVNETNEAFAKSRLARNAMRNRLIRIAGMGALAAGGWYGYHLARVAF